MMSNEEVKQPVEEQKQKLETVDEISKQVKETLQLQKRGFTDENVDL
jgi:hypothetical protein